MSEIQRYRYFVECDNAGILDDHYPVMDDKGDYVLYTEHMSDKARYASEISDIYIEEIDRLESRARATDEIISLIIKAPSSAFVQWRDIKKLARGIVIDDEAQA